MKIRKEYIDKLKNSTEEESDIDKFFNFTQIHYLNPDYKEVLLEDVTQIDFNALYPNLLVSLIDEGLIDEKWREDINKVKWFLENRKNLKILSLSGSTEYEKWKIHTNSLYSNIKTTHVTSYLDLFYTDLIKKYSDEIIYIDVDMVILNIKKIDFQTKKHIEEIYDFDFDASFIEYFYIERLKKYFIKDESGELYVKGFTSSNKSKKQEWTLFIKTLIREKRLQNLGI